MDDVVEDRTEDVESVNEPMNGELRVCPFRDTLEEDLLEVDKREVSVDVTEKEDEENEVDKKLALEDEVIVGVEKGEGLVSVLEDDLKGFPFDVVDNDTRNTEDTVDIVNED